MKYETERPAFFFAVLFAVFSILSMFTGYADNGDFYRSIDFLIVRPVGFSVMWPSPDSLEYPRRFFHSWIDGWFINKCIIVNKIQWVKSYSIYLMLQVLFCTIVTWSASVYSVVIGSMLSRFIVLGASLGTIGAIRKFVSIWAAWWFAFALLLICFDAGWVAFLNSFYEEQVAIIFGPLLAYCLFIFVEKKFYKMAPCSMVLSALIGSSKVQFFYLPTLVALFLLSTAPRCSICTKNLAKALCCVVLCQVIAFLPVVTNGNGQINAYHSLYTGGLDTLQRFGINVEAIGNKVVMRECVGRSGYGPGDDVCVIQSKAAFVDLAHLFLQEPQLIGMTVDRLYDESKTLRAESYGMGIDGAPCFAGLWMFNVMPYLYAHGFVLVNFVLVVFLLVVYWVNRGMFSSSMRSLMSVGLFLFVFGVLQYVISVGDGFYDITKHLVIGNYLIALAFVYLIPVFVCWFNQFVRWWKSST